MGDTDPAWAHQDPQCHGCGEQHLGHQVFPAHPGAYSIPRLRSEAWLWGLSPGATQSPLQPCRQPEGPPLPLAPVTAPPTPPRASVTPSPVPISPLRAAGPRALSWPCSTSQSTRLPGERAAARGLFTAHFVPPNGNFEQSPRNKSFACVPPPPHPRRCQDARSRPCRTDGRRWVPGLC